MSGLGWNKYSFGRQQGSKSNGKQYFPKKRLCRICGKPAEIGDMCQNCRDFIKHKKHEERRDNK